MRCPDCNSKNKRVVNVYHAKRYTRRYCKCLDCNNKFQTIECYITDSKLHLRTPEATLKLPSVAGTKNGAAVLTDQNILDIRKLHKEGKTNRAIAAIYGINNGHVSRIINRKAWTHIQ